MSNKHADFLFEEVQGRGDLPSFCTRSEPSSRTFSWLGCGRASSASTSWRAFSTSALSAVAAGSSLPAARQTALMHKPQRITAIDSMCDLLWGLSRCDSAQVQAQERTTSAPIDSWP